MRGRTWGEANQLRAREEPVVRCPILATLEDFAVFSERKDYL